MTSSLDLNSPLIPCCPAICASTRFCMGSTGIFCDRVSCCKFITPKCFRGCMTDPWTTTSPCNGGGRSILTPMGTADTPAVPLKSLCADSTTPPMDGSRRLPPASVNDGSSNRLFADAPIWDAISGCISWKTVSWRASEMLFGGAISYCKDLFMGS